MSDEQYEDLETRRESVGEWLDIALENAEAAILLSKKAGLEKQALYMTQQSMEASIKGLARWVGLRHSEVRVESHNIIHLYAKVLRRIAENRENEADVNQMLSSLSVPGEAYDVLKELRELLDLTNAPSKADEKAKRFFEELAIASPMVTKNLLAALKKQYKVLDTGVSNLVMLKGLISKPFKIRVPLSNQDVVTEFSNLVVNQVVRRCKKGGIIMKGAEISMLRRRLAQMARQQVNSIGIEGFRREIEICNGEIRVSPSLIFEMFDVPKAAIGIIIVGSLVWPHESYLRYPIDPAFAHLSLEEAASERKLGTRHYTDELGAITYIRDLAVEAQRVANLLERIREAGLPLPSWEAPLLKREA